MLYSGVNFGRFSVIILASEFMYGCPSVPYGGFVHLARSSFHSSPACSINKQPQLHCHAHFLEAGSELRQRQWPTPDVSLQHHHHRHHYYYYYWERQLGMTSNVVDICISLCCSAAPSTHTGAVFSMEVHNHRVCDLLVSPIVRLSLH